MLLETTNFLPFGFRTPYENMAVDEFILEHFLANGMPFFRLYGWQPAGLSIGVNQPLSSIDEKLCRDESVPVVRRMTGGGAILHDREITYSLVVPIEIAGKGAPIPRTFELVNSFILHTYRTLGLSPAYAKDTNPEKKHGLRSSFCFSASEEFDVIVSGKKIGGNAQARRKGAIFQHGSIPLYPTEGERFTLGAEKVTEYTSLSELLGRDITPEETAEVMIKSFSDTFGATLVPYEFSMPDKKRIVSLMTEKYSNSIWNSGGK